jgi:viroplasmin and RNaseH domain-containing protein
VILTCHSNEAKAKVNGYSSACHKHFETQDQAEAFNTNFEKAKRYKSAVELSPDTTLESMMSQLVIN